MKELDLLLERFLVRGFEAWPDAELDALEALLESADQDILAWLSGATKPPDPARAAAADSVRAHL